MKFLCVDCDEAMRLESTLGPDHGSMTILFACPSCGRRTAMLTNAMETQLVRSLGVKVGGRSVPPEPMETVRGSLVHSRRADEAPGEDGTSKGAQASASKCPFTGVLNDAFLKEEAVRWTEAARQRIDRIPPYARALVITGVEESARARGLTEITESVLDEVRNQFGM